MQQEAVGAKRDVVRSGPFEAAANFASYSAVRSTAPSKPRCARRLWRLTIVNWYSFCREVWRFCRAAVREEQGPGKNRRNR